MKKYVIKYVPGCQFVTKDNLHPLSDNVVDALVFTKFAAAKAVVFLLSQKIPKQDLAIITLLN